MREFRDGKRRRPKQSTVHVPRPMPDPRPPRRGPGNTYRIWTECEPDDFIDVRAVSREAAFRWAAEHWGLRDRWEMDILRGVVVE